MAKGNANKTAKTQVAAAAGGKAGKTAKPVKVKKSKNSGILRVVIVTVLVVLLLGAAGTVGYFGLTQNLFKLRDKTHDLAVSVAYKLDPETADKAETLNKREAELDLRQAQLDAYAEKLAKDESNYADKLTELEKWEQEIKNAESSLRPIFRPPLNEQSVKDMQSVSKTYAAMSPEEAANILTIVMRVRGTDYTAAVIYYMKEASAAAILAEMSPSDAATITAVLLEE
ncbi:MAG: hypothetical protein LBS90_06935 [Oscillospiraceae bacterium]|jgi:flagellar motility protein MotE (MotC chaperone)|nr:hypothetical protein [Oscillospiraceae bacterium]